VVFRRHRTIDQRLGTSVGLVLFIGGRIAFDHW
jgi:hypothetical protein